MMFSVEGFFVNVNKSAKKKAHFSHLWKKSFLENFIFKTRGEKKKRKTKYFLNVDFAELHANYRL